MYEPATMYVSILLWVAFWKVASLGCQNKASVNEAFVDRALIPGGRPPGGEFAGSQGVCIFGFSTCYQTVFWSGGKFLPRQQFLRVPVALCPHLPEAGAVVEFGVPGVC